MTVMEYRTIDQVKVETLADLQGYLCLERHPEYPGHFLVSSLGSAALQEDYGDLIGAYRAVGPLRLKRLAARAEEKGQEVVFLEDPSGDLAVLESLSGAYPHEIAFEPFPFQLEGWNFLRDQKADIPEWSTGTGKSVYACMKAKDLLERGLVDQVIVLSKGGKRLEWYYDFLEKAMIEPTVLGFREWRGELAELSGKAARKKELRQQQYEDTVLITNYEKFRTDRKEFERALKGKRVYFVFDEMPMKLKNHTSQLYRAVKAAMGRCSDVWASCLSATPIDNGPEDVYWCVRLMSPDTLDPHVATFRNRYVKKWDWFNKGEVAVWDTVKLQELRLRLGHMIHSASKYHDPEIAAQFPEEHWETIPVEMSASDRRLYDSVRKDIVSEFWQGGLSMQTVFTRMTPLQLISNNPSVLGDGEVARRIRASGKPPTDKNCNKLKELRDLLLGLEGKTVLFTAFNEYGAHWLHPTVESWGLPAVLYDGSSRQQEIAKRRFREDPACRVFVSSDQGSDSINLEAAVNVVNYDLPWKYSTLLQRVNRVSRITSKDLGHHHVFYYNLVHSGTIEDRKQIILKRKKEYAEAIFGGPPPDDQVEEFSKMSRGDVLYMLTGDEEEAQAA